MLTNALIAAGAVCIFYFVMYMVVVDLTNLFTWFWLIAGAGLIGIALLRRYAEKKSISCLWQSNGLYGQSPVWRS